MDPVVVVRQAVLTSLLLPFTSFSTDTVLIAVLVLDFFVVQEHCMKTMRLIKLRSRTCIRRSDAVYCAVQQAKT